ncbi:chemotaxis protein CheB [Dyadobacter bucti]|uniref:chemotaxis protein CheB n=1 Tax=Dyadobacter bucti TaxID=2572203 RepID=UPI001E2C107C|nr:chemotaxis protein CheB [Dyadobacter bucti]
MPIQNTEPHHVIAIGASAGGLEELSTFFEHTPLDGVSYVIVQHLSPDFKSRMVELLSSHSKLTVQEAEEGMSLMNNQVYLIPNDKFMTIQSGRLHLTGKEDVRGPHMTINTFFTSLAADSGPKAIAVVLSGLGSDGTDGIKAIKRAGGMVIARDPQTSEFSSMPSNVVATGMADFILEPQAMPSAIEDYVKREIDLLAAHINDDHNMAVIIDLIGQQLPLDFSDYKKTTILRRIKRRAAYGNFNQLENYLVFLKANPQEVEALAKDFLISVTAFFRDKEAFEFIEKKVMPQILEDLTPEQEIRMWVTGCATGEEAYSMAILVTELLGEKIHDHEVKIFATDIDGAALVVAGKGVYGSDLMVNVSNERLDKYFTQEGDNYKVKAEIRKMVIFAQHDLVKNPPYCNMHFVSCRNLLIYMAPVLQKKVYLMLLFGLKQGGYLFLGSSENPLPILQSLEVVSKKWKIYRNLDSNHAVSFDAFTIPESLYKKTAFSNFSQHEVLKNTDRTLSDAVNETLFDEWGCLVVCIDQNYKVIKSYGDTSKFLIQKVFTSDLTELLSAPLAVALTTVCQEVFQTQRNAGVNGVTIMQGGEVQKVNLSVSPMVFKGRKNGLLVVSFFEYKEDSQFVKGAPIFDEKIYLDKYVVALQLENRELKERLAESDEKLFSLNENMQSFNEELLSANEEMQSTNEEMQSVNEELHTINSDYQLKNRELAELNDDLNNYFRSNINGQLFVDSQFRLMKFSPGMVTLINLLESDIGRPIANISTNFKLETIIADIQSVVGGGAIVKKEIQANDGRWYQVMTMPYLRKLTNKTDGAIITFDDITELKTVQDELARKNKSLTRINEDLDNFVHTASHDLLSPLGAIEGSIALMNQIQVADPELNQFLSIIDASVKKFRVLISDIAAIAKIENNAIATEQVDLEEILDNVVWSLDDKIKSSSAYIIRELHVERILFSRKNLRSILFNLVSNAIKFRSDKSPVILIKSEKLGLATVLSVEDNGVGFDSSKSSKIFDKYGRIKVDVEGQGIGLYLAKKIVDAAGGEIQVESEPGKGSKFSIFFNVD